MRLICLIASHISTPKRIKYFNAMIASVLSQTKPPDRILISISKAENCNWPILLGEAEKRYEIIRQPIKMSQFQHYDFLSKKLENEDDENTWIIFGDDDDVWHKLRTETYYSWLHESCENADNILSIVSGAWKKGTTLESAELKIETKNNFEHWNKCIKLKYFLRFLRYTTDACKQHIYCDILFSSYIATLCADNRLTLTYTAMPLSNNWMYWYRTGECDSVCNMSKKNITIPQGILLMFDYFFAAKCGQIHNKNAKKDYDKLINDFLTMGIPKELIAYQWIKSVSSSVFAPVNIKKLYESSLKL
jgi:hypothetical protein